MSNLTGSSLSDIGAVTLIVPVGNLSQLHSPSPRNCSSLTEGRSLLPYTLRSNPKDISSTAMALPNLPQISSSMSVPSSSQPQSGRPIHGCCTPFWLRQRYSCTLYPHKQSTRSPESQATSSQSLRRKPTQRQQRLSRWILYQSSHSSPPTAAS